FRSGSSRTSSFTSSIGLEPLSLALAAGIEGLFLDRQEKCRTFFRILPLSMEVKFALNGRKSTSGTKHARPY
ncbi:hypothetical protein, partial [Mesorhizobium sp. M5C.F.Ca.IN.020.32.2.1]|uniref:hypothetical protein n=1 Tax=Mesorhizobium sp. M5C.F.Ca.IN.020.32.2.1 TaxID=2496771 RepID=UPI0019D49AF1